MEKINYHSLLASVAAIEDALDNSVVVEEQPAAEPAPAPAAEPAPAPVAEPAPAPAAPAELATEADEAQAISDEADALLEQIDQLDQPAAPADVVDEAQAINEQADALLEQIEAAEQAQVSLPDDKRDDSIVGKCAAKDGIEKEISDSADGGIKTTSTLVKDTTDADEIGEVVSQKALVSSIVARLDKVADILEQRGHLKMAFRVDQLSDRLVASVK